MSFFRPLISLAASLSACATPASVRGFAHDAATTIATREAETERSRAHGRGRDGREDVMRAKQNDARLDAAVEVSLCA